MRRAIDLERTRYGLMQNEVLTEDPERQACEQALERTIEDLKPHEQMIIRGLRIRSEIHRLNRQNLRATEAHKSLRARFDQHMRKARLSGDGNFSAIQELLFMVGPDFEFYDEDGEQREASDDTLSTAQEVLSSAAGQPDEHALPFL